MPWTQPLTSAALCTTARHQNTAPTQGHAAPSAQTTPKPLWFPALFMAGGAARHEAELL